ncbi:hypothetical protein, partial [Lachnoclostridium sp.]|uniref:hypothetical protein n=1 Tax=Lachnoclostridium sp. TaxID=2028282 RepID=UPI00289A7E23
PKENEMLCETCGGTGWLYENERKYIQMCPSCYSGVIRLCPICKQQIKGYCMNKNCLEQREVDNENRLLSKATKVNYDDAPDEYKEMMYSNKYPYNEGYFDDLWEFIERCEDEEITVPDYVWSTQKITLSMDAGSIIENACEELHEDANQNITGEKELQDFLDAWCHKQTGVESYIVDYRYAIKVRG